MLKNHKPLFNRIAKSVIKEQMDSQKFSNRIDDEIKKHRESMLERRKKFNLIRNK